RPPEALQALVAPVALYPDALLAQTLVASTYPLEIVQLQQWLAKHPELKDQALADSVAKQDWDPSIQSMAALPDVVKRLADDIQWTTDLGNAFLAQQNEVMDAVQVMRKKAKEKGALETNEQQVVKTEVVEKKEVIIVESADPEVIYVPSYSPTVVYGAAYPYYPYPPIYYPPYPPGAAFVSFSFGMMWGAAMWGGSCCGCGWGHSNNIYINNNNNFNRVNHNTNIGSGNTNIGSGNRGDRGQGNRGQGGQGGRGGNWSHNPEHRGGAPYGDKKTADRFGGATASDRASQRAGVSDRTSQGLSQRSGSDRAAAANRGGAGVSDRAGQSNRGSAGVSDRSRGGAGGSDRVGNRDIPSSGSRDRGSRNSGFNGGSRGYDGGASRSSRSRGSSSMGGRSGGGGMRGGGGGRGGGGRR
ncbi:MAG TPA: DUF3300 domain-containing protein, partial [bacterium]|nr:DUF3300 domain-containing protein [bacterium]